MSFRSMISFAAGALLAAQASAQGTGGGSNQQPPADEKSWYQKDAEKAEELGQQGVDATKKGAQSAGQKLDEAGEAAEAKVTGTKTLTGKVADVSQDQVTVKAGDAAPLNLRVTASTQVTVDGEKASVDSLKQGDKVRASYKQSGGTSTATKLEVKRSGSSGTTGSKSPSGTGSQ
jgi:Cu/Ag efflux protein CusF